MLKALARPTRSQSAVLIAAVAASAFMLVLGVPGVEELLPYRVDLDVYRQGALALAHGGDLYGPLPGLDLVFTYPPFAAALLHPLTWLPLRWATVALSAASVAAAAVAARACGTRSWLLLALPALWLFPARQTVGYGQINLLLMMMVLVDVVWLRSTRWRGVLIGLAAAVKLTPLVFLGYFLVRRDWRGLVNCAGSALAATAVTALAFPSETLRFFSSAMFETGRVGAQWLTTNQSLTGALARAGMTAVPIWLALSACVICLGLVLAGRLSREGDVLGAVSVVAVIGLLISPISWTHHWVWALPALAVAWRWARGRAVLPTAVFVSGALVFLVNPAMFVPFTPGSPYPWWKQVIGSSFVWWALAFLTAGLLRTRLLPSRKSSHDLCTSR